VPVVVCNEQCLKINQLCSETTTMWKEC